jgi:hypothetical protein
LKNIAIEANNPYLVANIKKLYSLKNNRNRKNDSLANRMSLGNHRLNVPHAKLATGSVLDKFPIVLDGGRTVIFISDKSKEAEIRLRYGLHGH